MVYADKEMLLMKKRSDGTASKYAECDDQGNLHVALDTGGIPVVVEGDVSVNNFPATQPISGSVSVGNFPATQPISGSVDLVSTAQLDTHAIQQTRVILNGYKIVPALTKANYSISNFYAKPSTPFGKSFMFYMVNPMDVSVTVYFKNGWTTLLGQVASARIASVTVPAATNTLFTALAWSSCFTDIGGVLTDESNDLNDPGASDVPFPFAAIDDAIYFGSTTPFNAVTLTTGTAGVYNATGAWEYWNGTGWGTLTVNTEYPSSTKTTPFKTTGGSYYSWAFPSDWVIYDIPGSPLETYWVRFRITAFTSRTTTPALSQGSYQPASGTINYAYAIDNLFADGDLYIVMKTDADSLIDIPAPLFWQLKEI